VRLLAGDMLDDLLLAESLGHHIVNAYRVWIDEVERELAA
jgi:hypothetical protein